MKKLVVALLVVGSTLACNSNRTSETTTAVQEDVAEASFACPMNCEEDKTYKEEGKCPVCKMDLKEIKN